ncbi:MAG: DUF302 domain-containing protein [Pseudomonadota bacterium]
MRFAAVCFLIVLTGCATTADDGLKTVPSAYDVPTTVQRLEAALTERGMTIFNTIDHAAGAARVDQSLRPTVLVVFGNPRVGSRLMNCEQRVGIDLPMKALIYEAADGVTYLSYNPGYWIAERHGLGACFGVVENVNNALAAFANAATAGS